MIDEWTKFRHLKLLAVHETLRMRERSASYERTVLLSRLAIQSSKQLLERLERVSDRFHDLEATPRKGRG